LRIISNLAVKRLARARVVYPAEAIGGAEVVEGILEAFAFADADPFRCATHNKGIMNGIDAVVIATGNDFRAVEAGAHAYAARKSTEWRRHWSRRGRSAWTARRRSWTPSERRKVIARQSIADCYSSFTFMTTILDSRLDIRKDLLESLLG